MTRFITGDQNGLIKITEFNPSDPRVPKPEIKPRTIGKTSKTTQIQIIKPTENFEFIWVGKSNGKLLKLNLTNGKVLKSFDIFEGNQVFVGMGQFDG
jgi:hypothetical protein